MCLGDCPRTNGGGIQNFHCNVVFSSTAPKPAFVPCRINDDIFAFVPFLDMANHSMKPNADFRLNASSKLHVFKGFGVLV